MARAKIKATPASKMRYRAIENVAPGAWWLGKYQEEGGPIEEMWTQVSVSMDIENIHTGRKFVRVFGTCTDGTAAEMVLSRGEQVLSLTAQQGRSCGLEGDE